MLRRNGINSSMRINELLSEKKLAAPTASQCSIGRSRLSNVRYSQCVSRGMLNATLTTLTEQEPRVKRAAV